ncbi:amyloid fiber anchoring/assembly protein TapA [Fervidibacillus halotolerans]|uniref:Amyloid fiber anchoring/assembly protein TapA n=1 Tax=Fervidibacillus halotolerans TaxID=2980027 RepID=A0A9E8RZP3_9BACI|nr:amyloid fiber anchoring/assembly protein TapA [Fervidibacillus halotolerans]WAA11837.1 amyloid fiber anchoring/assembly protein TapA [Fervidibacillus halotolerans]
MRTIRVSRTRKYKKSKGFVIGYLVSSLCYLLIISGVLLSESTNALFNDMENTHGFVHVNWDSDDGEEDSWDKSSLSFIDQGGVCKNIWATIQNGKDSKGMEGPSTYEVYFVKKGNPKKGEKVGEGEVPPLESGETATLTFAAEKNGNYKFKVYQRPGHPGKGELWSETIKVTDCKKKKMNSEEPMEESESTDSEMTEEKQTEQNNESSDDFDSEQTVEEEEKVEEEMEEVEQVNESEDEPVGEEENEPEDELEKENEPDENNPSQETEDEGIIGEQNP